MKITESMVHDLVASVMCDEGDEAVIVVATEELVKKVEGIVGDEVKVFIDEEYPRMAIYATCLSALRQEVE